MFKKKAANATGEKVYKYEPLGKLANILKYLFIAVISLSALGMVVDGWGIFFVSQLSAGIGIATAQDQGALIDGCAAIISIVGLLVHIITGVAFLRWVYLLRRNMSALNAPFFEGHPLDAVAAFIIPIVNLFQPLINAQNIWKATDLNFPNDRHWAGATSSSLIKMWWFFWVFQNIIHQVAAFIASSSTKKGATLQSLPVIYLSSGVAEGLSIVAAVLAMKVVLSLTARQEQYQNAVAMRAEQTMQPETEAPAQTSTQPETDAQS